MRLVIFLALGIGCNEYRFSGGGVPERPLDDPELLASAGFRGNFGGSGHHDPVAGDPFENDGRPSGTTPSGSASDDDPSEDPRDPADGPPPPDKEDDEATTDSPANEADDEPPEDADPPPPPPGSSDGSEDPPPDSAPPEDSKETGEPDPTDDTETESEDENPPSDDPPSDDPPSDDGTTDANPTSDDPQSAEAPPSDVDPDSSDDGKCNQGLGNGDEGCDPGNSNHNNPTNDEDGGTPGDGGRKGPRHGSTSRDDGSASDDDGSASEDDLSLSEDSASLSDDSSSEDSSSEDSSSEDSEDQVALSWWKQPWASPPIHNALRDHAAVAQGSGTLRRAQDPSFVDVDLGCSPDAGLDMLFVTTPTGNFDLHMLDWVRCVDDPSRPGLADTIVGIGQGDFDGEPADIWFAVVGEPDSGLTYEIEVGPFTVRGEGKLDTGRSLLFTD